MRIGGHGETPCHRERLGYSFDIPRVNSHTRMRCSAHDTGRRSVDLLSIELFSFYRLHMRELPKVSHFDPAMETLAARLGYSDPHRGMSRQGDDDTTAIDALEYDGAYECEDSSRPWMQSSHPPF